MFALRLLGLILVWAVLCATPLTARAEGVPLPVLAKAKGTECVRPVAEMRRNHMDLLMHTRDDTVHEGVRLPKVSWKGCVDCHAATHPDVEDGTVRTLYPFCVQCHEYAAVKFDCLQCHSDRLDETLSASQDPKADEADRLLTMIKGHLGGETQ
ncbi:MAG: Hdr-like menaquinol oxidoreductase cytochrome c subunit [Magnetospiraceae bacterium]